MMRATVLIGLALFGLAACQTGIEPTLQPVKAALSGSVSQDRLLGTQSIMIRTYTGKGSARAEVSGQPCTLSAAEFSAKVTTPQAVIVPTFLQGARFANRGRPGALTVTCNGAATTVEAQPTGGGRAPVTTPGAPGPAGALQTTTGVFVGNGAARPWAYPPFIDVALP
jgi:hypothetical protein